VGGGGTRPGTSETVFVAPGSGAIRRLPLDDTEAQRDEELPTELSLALASILRRHR